MTTATEQPNGNVVVNLRAAKKQQAAARKAHPAGTEKPAAKTAPAKAPAAKKAPATGRPVPQPRPEQRPGEGELKVRLGAAIKVVVSEGKVPESVVKKISDAHVYKDGSVVIVLTKAEAKAVKSVLAGQTSRGAQAVIKAIGQ